MRFTGFPVILLTALLAVGGVLAATIKPKVFILSTWGEEARVWRGIREFDVFANNVTVPGLSPLYPVVSCTVAGDVCVVTLGEGVANAAISTAALMASPAFDLTSAYLFLTGIALINPKNGTLGSVTFARYAVQFGVQHELDARQIPRNLSTGYIPLGAKSSSEYPQFIYGTEVFELNAALRHTVAQLADRATLNDTDNSMAYRVLYENNLNTFAAGTQEPYVVECDTVTSDTWYSGSMLGETLESHMRLMTNGTGTYCTAQQEDNAILAALLRGAAAKPALVDFNRVILMRTGSDFDREYWGGNASENLLWTHSGGQVPALRNIYFGGIKVIQGILGNWTQTFAGGVKPTNYVGDILGTLGGAPDFGPGKLGGSGGGRAVID